MHRFVILLTCTAGIGLAIASCGGVAGNNLFGTGGSGASGPTTSQSSGTGAVTATSSSSGTGGTGGLPGTSSTSGTAGTTASSSATTTSSTTSSSSSGMSPTQVPCGSQPPPPECAVGQICCFDTMGFDDQCGTPGQCGQGYVEISCEGPADCPGEFCCGDVDFNMNPPYLGVSCQPTCDDPTTQVVLCSLDNQADMEACPAGTTCEASTVLDQGYYVCNPTM